MDRAVRQCGATTGLGRRDLPPCLHSSCVSVRRLVRGTVPWEKLETVARELVQRYEQDSVRVTFFEADNWLSTPCVVNDRWFVKVISPQNALVHALFTGARNLGAFSSGTEGFFERFESPAEMARHELEATERMREIGLNAPEPIEAFEIDDLGILVLSYLESFEALGELDESAIRGVAPDIFEALSTMHDDGLVHGDLRAENILVQGEEVFFIDATAVTDGSIDEARAYDIASALAILEPHIGARDAVWIAVDVYGAETVLQAVDFLDFVNIRPDHDFDASAVKGAIGTRADQSAER